MKNSLKERNNGILNKHLSLESLKTLNKHPSGKNLLDKDGNPIKNYENKFLNFPLDDNKEKKNEIIYRINISNFNENLYENNLYVKNEKITLNKNNYLTVVQIKKNKNNIFDFTDFQKKLDQEITNAIISGKEYNSIENKLTFFLKI